MLSSMYGHGRTEAGVFLMGVLVNCEDNWEKRIRIVEAMTGIHTKPCADLLFGELKRVKSSNTTRRYLGAVIKVLSSMPSELIEEGFETLAEDRSFSPKMRDKFRAVWRSGSLKTLVMISEYSSSAIGPRLMVRATRSDCLRVSPGRDKHRLRPRP